MHEPKPEAIKDRTLGRYLREYFAIFGFVLQVGFPVLMFLLVIGFVYILSSAGRGMALMDEAFEYINGSSKAMAIIFLFTVSHLVGLGMILLSLFVLNVRARWFYALLSVSTFLWLFCGPIHIVLAVVVSRYLKKVRQEF